MINHSDRTYANDEVTDSPFFVGVEVEHTMAYGMKTLFVVGTPSADLIMKQAASNDCQHIYLGANHSFKPSVATAFNTLGCYLADSGFLVTIDLDIRDYDVVREYPFFERQNVIVTLSMKVPHIETIPYNTFLKIDDTGFNASNPGVWVHRLHDLQTGETFTPWIKYKEDTQL